VTDPFDLSGFAGWVPFSQLPDADVPAGPGVYLVMRPSAEPPTFLNVSPAGRFKGVDPTVAIAELEELWVPGAHIVYIGKANLGARGNRGLAQRLAEFRKYGAGAPIGHRGGRRIWQLTDHHELLVGWRVTDDADARPTERALLAAFRARYGKRPYANMTD
jgi:hypothetical protein